MDIEHLCLLTCIHPIIVKPVSMANFDTSSSPSAVVLHDVLVPDCVGTNKCVIILASAVYGQERVYIFVKPQCTDE